MSNLLYREKRLICGNNLLICLQSAIGCHWPPLLITIAHPISHKGCVVMQRKQMVWDQSTWQPHKYVTWLGKTRIVHTSNFSTLVSHKIYLEWWIDVKCSGIVELLFLYDSWKFHICIPFLWISKWAKSDVRTMHALPNPVTYVITLTTLACPKDPKLLTMFIPQPHKLASCWIEIVSVR